MRRQEPKSGPELGIRIEGKKGPFVAGDTVVGYVYRNTPTTSSKAQVKLSLHGQSHSLIVVSAGYSQAAVTGHFTFFDPQKNAQLLHTNQPLEIHSGGYGDTGAQWPFAITIPEFVEPAALIKPDTLEKQSYLPLDPATVASHPLPPTFELDKAPSGGLIGIIEYYLKAELRLTLPSKSFFTGQPKTETHEAIMPLRIERDSLEPPVTDFRLRSQSLSKHIQTQRLLPGMGGARLSFSQKTQKVFGSSKVPELQLQINVAVPTAIQLGCESTVPFLVGIEPVWERTSEGIRGVAQSIVLDSLVVRLKPSTSVRTKSGSKKARSITYAKKEVDLLAVNRAGSSKGSIQIPCVAADAAAEYPEPVDIGELVDFNLSLRTIRSIIGRQRDITQLYPSFTTYNIQHEHQLSWELHGNVEGEEIRLSGSNAVTLLPKTSSGAELPVGLDKFPIKESY